MKRSSVKLCVLVPTALLAACSWFTPSHVTDVAHIVDCVLEHETLPPPQNAEACGIENVQEVIDIIAAHRAALARERAAMHPDAGAAEVCP